MASISEPFIRRPVGTTLLAIGLFLVGIVAYVFLPVSAVPNVEFPMIRVSAARPGADPSVMAATVAAPLERRLGQIAGIEQITSTSSLGTTSIQLQFAIGRDIDRATARRRSMRRWRTCRATCHRCRDSVKPIRRLPRCSCWR
jgi:multidrug efflux pump